MQDLQSYIQSCASGLWGFTGMPGKRFVWLKLNNFLRVAGDDEGSLPTT